MGEVRCFDLMACGRTCLVLEKTESSLWTTEWPRSWKTGGEASVVGIEKV